MTYTSFRQYLLQEESDIAKTKRKGIIHLQDMKPVEALQFLRNIKDELKGKLDNIPVTLKVDGGSLRFGKDKHGHFFLETGNSGPIQHHKAFSTFTKNKGGSEVMIERAVHYDDIYEHLEKSDLWKDMPDDTKVSCEILYNPMAEEAEDEHLKFVSIKYDKQKLGKLMTLIPITASVSSSGEEHVSKEEVISDLLKKTNADIRVVSPKLGHLKLEVSALLSPLSLIGEDGEQVLKSLKHADKPLKQEYQTILNAIKSDLADVIMKHPIKGRDVLGKDIEGYVIDVGGKLFKVTTPSFKQAKRDERLSRLNEISLVLQVTDMSDDISFIPNLSNDFRTLLLGEDSAQPLPEPSKIELDKIKKDTSVLYGTMNQIEIYVSGVYQGYHTFVIFDENTEEPLSFVVLQTEPVIINGEERTKEVRSWTKPSQRGKGYATSIYQFLIKKLELKLICDDMLSDDAVQMYKQFISKRKFDNITFYNEKTKSVQQEEPEDLWVMPNVWRILIEGFGTIGSPKPLYGKPGPGRLGETCYNNEGLY